MSNMIFGCGSYPVECLLLFKMTNNRKQGVICVIILPPAVPSILDTVRIEGPIRQGRQPEDDTLRPDIALV